MQSTREVQTIRQKTEDKLTRNLQKDRQEN